MADPDLRALCQAVVDGRDWSRGRLVQALGVVTTCPEDVDALSRAILAALNAADGQGYARAMGEVEAHAETKRVDADRVYGPGSTRLQRSMEDLAEWAREQAAAAERD